MRPTPKRGCSSSNCGAHATLGSTCALIIPLQRRRICLYYIHSMCVYLERVHREQRERERGMLLVPGRALCHVQLTSLLLTPRPGQEAASSSSPLACTYLLCCPSLIIGAALMHAPLCPLLTERALHWFHSICEACTHTRNWQNTKLMRFIITWITVVKLVVVPCVWNCWNNAYSGTFTEFKFWIVVQKYGKQNKKITLTEETRICRTYNQKTGKRRWFLQTI
jgi:hypothetical protein